MTIAKEWYYVVKLRGEQQGPLNFEELKRLANLGHINREYSWVRSTCMRDWILAALVEGLFAQSPLLIMQESEIAEYVLDIMTGLVKNKGAGGHIPAKHLKKRYRFSITLSYYQFYVKFQKEDTYYDDEGYECIKYEEYDLEYFGDVLRVIQLGSMVREEWERLTVRDFDTAIKLEEIRKRKEEWYNSPREKYARYLVSDEWKAIRQEALERAKHRCQICNGDSNLQVHHRYYRGLGKEQPEDLTVLCEECHKLYEDHKKLPKPPDY